MSPGTAGPWRWLALLSVLLLGASLGVLAERLVLAEAPEPAAEERSTGEIWFDCSEAPRERTEEERSMRRSNWVAEVQEALSLDDGQTHEVEVILAAWQVNSREFWNDTRQDYCTMQGTLRQDVRVLLRPDQRPLFDERIRRIDDKLRERHQRSGESEDSSDSKRR